MVARHESEGGEIELREPSPPPEADDSLSSCSCYFSCFFSSSFSSYFPSFLRPLSLLSTKLSVSLTLMDVSATCRYPAVEENTCFGESSPP